MDILDPFILRSLIAGTSIAIITGTLGCFVVWKRMAYLGDSLSHTSLLGIVMGLITGLPIDLGIIIVCFLFSCILLFLNSRKLFGDDTVLGILAHSSLSFGLVGMSIFQQNFDLHSFLFGDILTLDNQDIVTILLGGSATLITLSIFWDRLVLSTVNQDIAIAEGMNPVTSNLILMTLLTLVIAVSIQFIGAILITSLMIIPPATARFFSNSPRAMAVNACLTGIIGVLIGIITSIYLDIPTGPTIICISACLFFIVALLTSIFK